MNTGAVMRRLRRCNTRDAETIPPSINIKGDTDFAFVVTSKFSKQKRLCRLLASDQQFPGELYLRKSLRDKGNPCQAAYVKELICLALKSQISLVGGLPDR